jgi:L-amino acid N-acyltransferase YncA
MSNLLQLLPFGDIDLKDQFFDSLKADYPGFDAWYERKANESAIAYVIHDEAGKVEGFLYLKDENGPVDDITPNLPPMRRLKVGTFKIDAHGTKLGDRFFKKLFDEAISRRVKQVYVTIFPKHAVLVKLFVRYGFAEIGRKPSTSGEYELVLMRDLTTFQNNIFKDYPYVHSKDRRKYLLSIQPKYHTQLLPDSILRTEQFETVKDLSHTNSIRKVYICFMAAVENLRPGDILVMYRTKPDVEKGSAEYLSVATSIGVVADFKHASDFPTVEDFIGYCEPFSVFDQSDLRDWFKSGRKTKVIKFTYNIAMTRRLIRKRLIEEVGLERDQYWGFFELSDPQFREILRLGGVDENLVID